MKDTQNAKIDKKELQKGKLAFNQSKQIKMAKHNCPSCGKRFSYVYDSVIESCKKYGESHPFHFIRWFNGVRLNDWKCLKCLNYTNCRVCNVPLDREWGVPYCGPHLKEQVAKWRGR